jgi:chromosome segregation ATPase
MNFFGKSYNEIEGELTETKSKIQLLEEKIECLIQKDIDMTKILCETNSKIQQLEEKLQKNTSSLVSFANNKFIDINCSNIKISYSSPYDTMGGVYFIT